MVEKYYIMEPIYGPKYFFAEKYGFIKYRRPDGSIGEFGYTHGGRWAFWTSVRELVDLWRRAT